MTAPRTLLASARKQLAEAGVESPDADAAILLAHVLDTDRNRLFLVDDVAEHQEKALVLGRRLYAEKPTSLTQRLGKLWKAAA